MFNSYLCIDSLGLMSVQLCIAMKTFEGKTPDNLIYFSSNVTHWKSLPELPKEVMNNDHHI